MKVRNSYVIKVEYEERLILLLHCCCCKHRYGCRAYMLSCSTAISISISKNTFTNTNTALYIKISELCYFRVLLIQNQYNAMIITADNNSMSVFKFCCCCC